MPRPPRRPGLKRSTSSKQICRAKRRKKDEETSGVRRPRGLSRGLFRSGLGALRAADQGRPGAPRNKLGVEGGSGQGQRAARRSAEESRRRRSHQRGQKRHRGAGHPEEKITDYPRTSAFQPEALSILPVTPFASSLPRKTKASVTDSGRLPR